MYLAESTCISEYIGWYVNCQGPARIPKHAQDSFPCTPKSLWCFWPFLLGNFCTLFHEFSPYLISRKNLHHSGLFKIHCTRYTVFLVVNHRKINLLPWNAFLRNKHAKIFFFWVLFPLLHFYLHYLCPSFFISYLYYWTGSLTCLPVATISSSLCFPNLFPFSITTF